MNDIIIKKRYKKNIEDISINSDIKKITSRKNTENSSINSNTKKKITSKKTQHGNGIIPYFSDNIVTSVQTSVDSGIVNVENFFRKIKQDYVNSIQKAASVKIGDQRLIQGGNKKYSKLSKNKLKPKPKPKPKSKSKSKSKPKHKPKPKK